ncbi:MAG: adenylate cyclase [Desulfobacula sp. RIFOXYB2_FULL_45_6]|nr:MAG: adenylate cyclase [Desulfobacula sp. RIFOXYB2_FULL_45_6]
MESRKKRHKDPENKAHWDSLSEEEKIMILRDAVETIPELAIIPVLAGITSYQFAVRNEAKKSLEIIRLQIAGLLADPNNKEKYFKGMKASTSVCFRIYAKIKPDMQPKETGWFFKLLIEFEGKGPYFAYMAVYKGVIAIGAMEQMMNTFSDSKRLFLVDQYLQAPPSVRLKFGFSFTRLLKSIKQRDAVILFYASLFDQNRDADPFLNNIPQDLRDPDKIISVELQSEFPEIKIMGLKALAMVSTKLSSDLLIDILTTETVRKVRLAIYQIIENSSLGTYADMFYPMMELFLKCDTEEAFQAFKALVVSGKLPVYTFLELVRDNYSSLMPMIHEELSTFSRISFFIIQDIALNKTIYLKTNLDINLACILGMMRKRPERVVKLLKKYDNVEKDNIREGITRFVEKTKKLLSLEKQSIETEFNSIIQGVKLRSAKNSGLIKSLFKDSTTKKIELLKTTKELITLHFDEETIKDVNLSSSEFIASVLFFDSCIFENCDLSKSKFANAYYKKTIFYNIDMRQTQFDSVNFEGTVFINVNAEGALFKRCSFQNISIFNCNFNHAQLMNAPFINTLISKTSFNQADLSGSCFAYSKISAVSFVHSNIDQTDFSSVSARFCRFPSSSKSIIRTENMNYNARKFQLSFEDIPQMNEAIVSEINMLIFSEFIHYGEMKFLKQNQLSLLTAFDIFRSKQADLFQIIPFLLHENIRFPGIETIDQKTPCGIYDYLPSIETREVFKQYNKKEPFIGRRSLNPLIEGLFTIGSTGSIAQTSDSDIDYWICINEEQLNPRAIDLLKKKLEMIEQMAWKEFETKVTFFLVDILKAKNNNFGDSTLESSGSAQARLLKEEFYRTMIHVAGKLPLWSVLPTTISINYYNSILAYISNVSNLFRYIDLGDIHAIPTSEYYGASIWQMFKWLKSPFKSVIKMALLEKYIFEYGKELLLCNKYKNEWMNSGTQLKIAQNDSYYILLNNLIRYFETAQDRDTISLLLTCFFLKLGISKDSEIDNTVFGLRKILFEQCILKWGWNKTTIFEIGGFKTWPYTDIATLSYTIEKFMIQKYKAVNITFERNFKGRFMISPEDRTVLGRKIFIEFSKQPGKVGKVLLISRSDRHFQGLQLKYVKKTGKIGTWELINKNTRSHQTQEESLIKAHTIEEIGAWLMNNDLYNEDSVIHLIPNPTYVTFDDIRKLFKTMHEFFSPSLRKEVGFDRLLLKSRVVSLFISINFYAPRQQHKVTEYTAVYMNSWGEMFCKSFYSEKGLPTLEETKNDIMKRIDIKKFPVNTAYYFSKGVAR